MSGEDWFFAGFFVASVIWITLIVFGIKFYRSMQHPTNSTPVPAAPTRHTTPRRNTNGDEVVSYRTRNGRSDYRFRLTRLPDGGYRAYILDHPGYGSRDASSAVTHRLSDSQGDYVCWTGRLKTREEARQVAATWADKTEDYILRGHRF